MSVASFPGYVIKRGFERPPPELVAQFSAYTTANLSDVMGKLNTLDYRIKPIGQPRRLLGVALTVKTRPGDNLLPLKAIELALPGDVIVIAGEGDTHYSVWGGIMSLMAVRQGVAGVVTDGLVRDAEQIQRAGLAVFSAGLTPVGPSKDGRGQINLPVSCGGVVVAPGDIVRGDEDGVVIVPRHEAEAVLARARERILLEKSWIERIGRGELILIDSDEQFVARGCRIEE